MKDYSNSALSKQDLLLKFMYEDGRWLTSNEIFKTVNLKFPSINTLQMHLLTLTRRGLIYVSRHKKRPKGIWHIENHREYQSKFKIKYSEMSKFLVGQINKKLRGEI